MNRLPALLMILMLLFPSCNRFKPDGEKSVDGANVGIQAVRSLPAPEDLTDRFSYAYGYLFSSTIEERKDISEEYFLRGMLDYFGTSYFSQDELDDILLEYQMSRLVIKNTQFEALSRLNRESAEAFLEMNSLRSGVYTLDSGLEYEIISKGNGGECVEEGDVVIIDYSITLSDGTLADASLNRGTEGDEFAVDSMLPGFREALMEMEEGDCFRFWIPPELGFGSSGRDPVGPNEMLIFEVKLLDVIK